MTLADIQPGIPFPPRQKPPAPLLPVALGLIAGIVADSFLTLPTWLSASLLAVGIAIFIAQRKVTLSSGSQPRSGDGIKPRAKRSEPWVIGSRNPQPPTGATERLCAVLLARVFPRKRVAFAAILIAAAGLGSFRHALTDRFFPDNHILLFTDDKPMIVQLQGTVLTPPRISEPDPEKQRAYHLDPKTRFIIQATHLTGTDGPIPVTGKVAVTVKDALLTLRVEDTVQLTGWFYRPRRPQNPGAYDWAQHQRRNGIHADISCPHAESITVLQKPQHRGWRRLAHALRTRLRGFLLDDAFEEDDPAAGVISAMVLGERSAVPKAMNEAFISTGNAHFLAASGMHVGWLALMGWGIARLLGFYYRTTAIFVGLLILSYVLLAEPRPSIMRAGIIGLLACTTIYVRGRYNAVNSLSLAVIIILMLDPADVFRPAFQYSFMAVLALLHLCPHIAKATASWFMKMNLRGVAKSFDTALYAIALTTPDQQSPSLFTDLRRKAGFLTAQLVALAFSAWFITAPLACYHFNNFPPFGWLQTLVLWLVAMPVTLFGFLTLLLGALLPSSGSICGPVLKAGTDLMVTLVQTLARIPGTLLDGRSPSTAWVLAVYAIVCIWVYKRHWLPGKHAFKVCALILILCWAVPPRWNRADSDTLKTWILAVGDGTGTVVELPNGKVILYDFGTRSPYDVGPTGKAFLEHRCITRLDAVFVSHANFDHYSGITALADDFDIGRLVINDQFEQFAPEDSAARRFLDDIRRRGIPIQITHGPHTFADLDPTAAVNIEAIWPPAADRQLAPNSNEASTVLRFTYQDHTILLTGDISETAMATLLDDPRIKADALALPHHGSVTPLTAPFLDAVDPKVAVRSTGQRRAMTIHNIESIVGNRQYLTTADEGCILLEIRNGQLTAHAATLPP